MTTVVLGGGGLAGIGWTTGVLAALEEAGRLRLADADRVVGTSAGAAVGAAVLQAGSASTGFDAMVRRPRRNPELVPDGDVTAAFTSAVEILGSGAARAEQATRFFALSAAHATVDPDRRRAVVAGRLAGDAWPATPLTVTATAADGSLATFDAGSGVSLGDAVTASCAVAGIWPVATVDGVAYVDGGTFSMTNAQLAADADDVLVIAPVAELPGPPEPARDAVLARATVIEPSDRARAGFGEDPFDPDVRGVAAVLGYEDAGAG